MISARAGKHTDACLDELVMSPEGKTEVRLWYTDNWGGSERMLPAEVPPVMRQENTQRLEQTHGMVRQ